MLDELEDDADWAADAELDPWCLVPLDKGHCVLFGYAPTHPVTGGLSWVVSSEVDEISAELCRARTRSGRRYRLGRRILPHQIPE